MHNAVDVLMYGVANRKFIWVVILFCWYLIKSRWVSQSTNVMALSMRSIDNLDIFIYISTVPIRIYFIFNCVLQFYFRKCESETSYKITNNLVICSPGKWNTGVHLPAPNHVMCKQHLDKEVGIKCCVG